jgi:hypothetical protein
VLEKKKLARAQWNEQAECDSSACNPHNSEGTGRTGRRLWCKAGMGKEVQETPI